jgi:tripartite-type tricarboxylate transporter receptor subunit TctC
MLPAGVPGDIVARLHRDVVRVLNLPEMQDRFAGEGGRIVAGTPEQFAALIRSEVAKWSQVIKASGARID